MNNISERSIFTVSQLNRRAKQLLETHLPLVWISGEISNLAKPSSGHWYFSLKDQQAQVRCAMFRNTNQRMRWQPTSGQQVLIRARVSLYEGRGEYQLIAEHMEAAGAGLLQQQYEILKDKLQSEGLFLDENKKPLPYFPKHIGIISSPTGAAIHDILSVLARRYPIALTTLIPVSVQGENAAPDMIKALNKAETFSQFDILIIGRGGGSIEDLWAFNDEQLARAIAKCSIPIVSAVGHEVDFTIADFVADQRAPTPSASAEIITPDLSEWLQTVDNYSYQLHNHIQRKILQYRQRLTFLHKRLRHPGEKISAQHKQLNLLQKNMIQAITRCLSSHRKSITHNTRRLNQQHPIKRIDASSNELKAVRRRLHQGIATSINDKKLSFATKVEVLNAISPLNVLARGYAIASKQDGNIIKTTKGLQVGDEISTQLADGSISSVITKCIKNE